MDRTGDAEDMTALKSGVQEGAPVPEIMFSQVGVDRLVPACYGGADQVDMSLGNVSLLKSALSGELVALL